MKSGNPHSDLDSLFQSFGFALAEWSRVEAQAYRFYSAMMAGANPDLISVNWHSIQSFDSKITLLDRCAVFAIPQEAYHGEWSPLLKRIRSASGERNVIAHGSIMSRVEKTGEPSPLYFGPSILDATAKLRGRLENRHYEYSSERLSNVAETFNALSSDISSLTTSQFPHARIDYAY